MISGEITKAPVIAELNYLNEHRLYVLNTNGRVTTLGGTGFTDEWLSIVLSEQADK
jgi:hypothetical protein